MMLPIHILRVSDISNRFICGIDVVRDAPGIRIAGYARSESITNRANHRPSSTWASLCIYQIDFPVYISARLHALDSEPTVWFHATNRRMLAMHGAHKLEMSAEAARSLSFSFTVSNRNLAGTCRYVSRGKTTGTHDVTASSPAGLPGGF